MGIDFYGYILGAIRDIETQRTKNTGVNEGVNEGVNTGVKVNNTSSVSSSNPVGLDTYTPSVPVGESVTDNSFGSVIAAALEPYTKGVDAVTRDNVFEAQRTIAGLDLNFIESLPDEPNKNGFSVADCYVNNCVTGAADRIRQAVDRFHNLDETKGDETLLNVAGLVYTAYQLA